MARAAICKLMQATYGRILSGRARPLFGWRVRGVEAERASVKWNGERRLRYRAGTFSALGSQSICSTLVASSLSTCGTISF
jgi:hypothetical protein